MKATSRSADSVVRVFEEKILSGALSEGQILPTERAIMEEFSVSRTVVREAIRTMANLGLLEAKPRHRPIIRKPSLDSALDLVESSIVQMISRPGGVKNLFNIRVMVETSLVRQATLEASTNDIRSLQEALKNCERAIGDADIFYKYDAQFHAVLYTIPQNPALIAVQRAFSNWLSVYWARMPKSVEKNKINHKAHSQILEAILLRDPDLAEKRMKEHLAFAWSQVRDEFEDSESVSDAE